MITNSFTLNDHLVEIVKISIPGLKYHCNGMDMIFKLLIRFYALVALLLYLHFSCNLINFDSIISNYLQIMRASFSTPVIWSIGLKTVILYTDVLFKNLHFRYTFCVDVIQITFRIAVKTSILHKHFFSYVNDYKNIKV